MSQINLKQFQEFQSCPIRNVLDRIGDKWSMLVLLLLNQQTLRFNEIQRSIGEISQKMLSVTLKHLEADGLVSRQLYPEIPPKVEYRLTPLGQSLIPQIKGLVDWSAEHMEMILSSRKSYYATKQQSNP